VRAAPLAAFVLGVCALQWLAELPAPAVLAGLSGAALLGGLFAARGRGAPSVALAAAAAFAAGFAYAGWRADQRLADALPFADEGRDVLVTGIVASLPVKTDRGVRFEFDVESHAAQAAVPSRVLLGWYAAGEPVQPGERWRFTVRLRRPHGALNPTGFDFEAWMLERNLRASGYVRDRPPPERLDAMVWTPGTAVERARAALRDRLIARLGDSRWGGVLLALVIGDQRAIDEADWALFNRTGISHLVSISGLHITMIAALIGGLVGALWRRVPALLTRAPAQTAAIVAGVTAAFAYAALAGWGVPAQRTVLMLAVVAAAWLARGRIPPGSALALAAAAVCLLDPWAVTAAGFWLSFGAVAAITWVVHGRPAPIGARGALATAARVQLAVTLALAPATVVLFQQVSLISPLANALAIPLVSWVVTPLALVGAALAALPAPVDALAAPLLVLAEWLFGLLAALLGWLAAPAWAAWPVPVPPWPLVLLALAGIAWLLAPPGWPLRALGAVALLPLFVWPAPRPGVGELWVTALDVGQGSAVVVETREATWVYDAGPRTSSDSDAGARVVLPYLRGRGIGALDGLVVSHLDSDHSGGAASIVRGVPVARVLTSIALDHPVLGGAVAERCVAGQRFRSGALELAVLHPTADDYMRRLSTNAMSCVLRVQLGPTVLLLTGDLPAREEAALVAREPTLRAAWMMAPHHGSRTSSSAALLDAVAPGYAVAQMGYRNRFGHPAPEVAARYAARGVALARTDAAGAVQWRFAADGAVEVRAWRAIAVRYWHNRPAAGQAESDEAADDEASEREPRDPLFGMP
jgi:competence protein ComEC